jgi:hypothetical protein
VFIPGLELLAGLSLVPLFEASRRPARHAIVALAVAGLYTIACIQDIRRTHNSIPRSTAVLTYIHQNALEDKSVFAPQADVPTLHYYFPAMRLHGYLGTAPRDVSSGAILLSSELTGVSEQ